MPPSGRASLRSAAGIVNRRTLPMIPRTRRPRRPVGFPSVKKRRWLDVVPQPRAARSEVCLAAVLLASAAPAIPSTTPTTLAQAIRALLRSPHGQVPSKSQEKRKLDRWRQCSLGYVSMNTPRSVSCRRTKCVNSCTERPPIGHSRSSRPHLRWTSARCSCFGRHPACRTTEARKCSSSLTYSIPIGVWLLLFLAEAGAPLLRRTALGVQLAGQFWDPLPASRARKDSASPHRPRKSGHIPRRSAGALSQR